MKLLVTGLILFASSGIALAAEPKCKILLDVEGYTSETGRVGSQLRICMEKGNRVALDIDQANYPTKSISVSKETFAQYSQALKKTLAELKSAGQNAPAAECVHEIRITARTEGKEERFVVCQNGGNLIFAKKLYNLIRDLALEKS